MMGHPVLNLWQKDCSFCRYLFLLVHSGLSKPPVDLIPTFPSTGVPISCSYCSYILPRQESRKNPNVSQQEEVFSILMCHPAQVREGNEDDPEVVAASFVGMHMEREGRDGIQCCCD